MSANKFKVSPYTWNRGKPHAEAGMIIKHNEGRYFFVPFEAVPGLCLAMSDLYEKQKEEKQWKPS